MRMNGYHFIKKFGFFCLILITVLLGGCKPPTTQSATMVPCTEAGCGTGLTLVFSGAVPSEFIMEAITPAGEKLEAHCIQGVGQYPEDYFSRSPRATCMQSGVEFFQFSPEEVSITLKWGDNQLSQTFKPTYTFYYPNGSGCMPVCSRGQITFVIP